MYDVMIVDDVEFMRQEIKKLKLWNQGAKFKITHEAANGRDAIKKLQECAVDLLITDIRMPVINGIELLQKVIEEQLATCVVLLSEHCEFSYAKQGLIYGAFDFMSKPVDENELSNVLQRAGEYIENKRAEMERVRELERSCEQANNPNYPVNYISQIIEHIKKGDPRAVEAAATMVGAIFISVESDLSKASVLVKRVLDDIVFAIVNTYPWLSKFFVSSRIFKYDLVNIKDMPLMKAAVLESISRITAMLNIFAFNGNESDIVRQVSVYVLENIDNNLSLSSISDNLHVNKTHLSETFKQKTGMGLVEYMTLIRLERAKALLVDGTLKVNEIADRLGYEDVGYFCRLFKEYNGLTPTEFKKANINIA